MIPGLDAHRFVRDGVGLSAWSGGAGPTVLLLHGYPQSSYMWRFLVPALLADHHVVLMDLRGYGESDAPSPDDLDHTYSKRAMAVDAAHVLDSLGVESAHLVGHDRGGRVVHRFCLDHPEIVTSAAVLDIVPTLHMFENVDRAMAEAYFHWFFLTRPCGLPEGLIRADVERWLRARFQGRHSAAYAFEEEALQVYLRAFSRAGAVEATCSDYRAAATVDLEHDVADRAAGRRVERPLLVAWGTEGYVGRSFDVPQVWQQYARDVRAAPVAADHYLAEENPEQALHALTTFWANL